MGGSREGTVLQPVWSLGVTKASFKVHTLFLLLHQNICPAAVNKIKIYPIQVLQTQCSDHLPERISIFGKPGGNTSHILIAG